MALDLKKCLQVMVEKNASDLHLKVGAPPIVRKNNSLVLLFKDYPCLTQQDIKVAISKILTPFNQSTLTEDKQLDFSYGIPELGRFRFNVFYQRGTLRLVARNIPFKIPTFQDLSLPDAYKSLVEKHQDGLILITGSTGNGKSSSVVSMLNHINKTQSRHILTIEDPIEFLIQDRKSLITQRELGTDYIDYEMALKSCLRQDPDIIFFGELRDKISTETALNAANTGHLVISTLHTNNVAETVNRVLGMFEKGKETQIRMEFASSLRAVICQKLLLKKDGNGFIPAVEILYNNPRVRSILEDETKSTSVLYEIIETSKKAWGMQSFNQHLIELTNEDLITQETALKASYSPEKLKLYFEGLEHNNDNNSGTLKLGTPNIKENLPAMEEAFQKLKIKKTF